VGIQLESPNTEDNMILNNDIYDNGLGFYLNGVNGDGVEYSIGTENEAHLNNIYDNTQGIENDNPSVIFDAINNWWGSNNPNFASLVYGNVNYTPWTTQSEEEVETEAGVPEEVDTTGTNASITLTTSSSTSGTVTVQQYSEDPHGGFGVAELGKFITIASTISDSEIDKVEVGIHYTDEELLASGIDETTLKIYWWNPTTSSWTFEGTTSGCHDAVGCYGVDTVNNYVWIVTDHFSDYGSGGGSDTEGPTITNVYIQPLFPNLLSALVKIFATIEDLGSGVDYANLYYQIAGDPHRYF
jgi:hypothetical protein